MEDFVQILSVSFPGLHTQTHRRQQEFAKRGGDGEGRHSKKPEVTRRKY